MITDASFVAPARDKRTRSSEPILAHPSVKPPKAVNKALPKKSCGPTIYGSVFRSLAYTILNMRAVNPRKRLFVLPLDTVAAFPWMDYHDAVLPIMMTRIFGLVMMQVRNGFGSRWAPGEYSYWEEIIMELFATLDPAEVMLIPEAREFAKPYVEAALEGVDQTAFADGLAQYPLDAFSPGIATESLAEARVFLDDKNLVVDAVGDNLEAQLTTLLWAMLSVMPKEAGNLRQNFVNVRKLLPYSTRPKI